MKRHVDARDDEICRRFTVASELAKLTPRKISGKGNVADSNRNQRFDMFANNRCAARYLG